MSARPRLLLLNHFNLETICGTTVMFEELLRVAPQAAPDVDFVYLSYEAFTTPGELRAVLDGHWSHDSIVVAINGHLEIAWDFTMEAMRWSKDHALPALVYAHDYWPHHKENMQTLLGSFDLGILASSPFIANTLLKEGFPSRVVEVGVPLPETWQLSQPAPLPKTVISAGRLVPRKRLADIPRAFARSGLDGKARLYLRVLPSNVFNSDSDKKELMAIKAEVVKANLTGVTIDLQAGDRPDYSQYAAYVCSSSYEGFSMTVIEAAFAGCPPLMSDIPPHRRNAMVIFGDRANEFLYPIGNTEALAALLRDELTTGRRKTLIDANLDTIRRNIASHWSLQTMAGRLAELALQSALNG